MVCYLRESDLSRPMTLAARKEHCCSSGLTAHSSPFREAPVLSRAAFVTPSASMRFFRAAVRCYTNPAAILPVGAVDVPMVINVPRKPGERKELLMKKFLVLYMADRAASRQNDEHNS